MRESLKLSELFSHLDDAALDDIASAATTRKFVNGEMLFYEGDPAHAFYVIASGRVKVFKLSADGKEQILIIARTGDSIAEAALFDGATFPASAQAMEDSELLVISRDKFVGLLGRNPDLAVNLIARLSGLLRQMTRLVEGLSLTDVTTRLAHYLNSQRDPKTGEQLTEIVLPVKKSILAAQLGTIPETLSRSLARLVKEKVIAVDGPRITVINAPALRSHTNPR